jgi:hypothetical protein
MKYKILALFSLLIHMFYIFLNSSSIFFFFFELSMSGVHLFVLKVGVDESIVNAPLSVHSKNTFLTSDP